MTGHCENTGRREDTWSKAAHCASYHRPPGPWGSVGSRRNRAPPRDRCVRSSAYTWGAIPPSHAPRTATTDPLTHTHHDIFIYSYTTVISSGRVDLQKYLTNKQSFSSNIRRSLLGQKTSELRRFKGGAAALEGPFPLLHPGCGYSWIIFGEQGTY